MWNDVTLNALDTWIGPEYRKARHPIDDTVFYCFVRAVWDETHTVWDERNTRQFIRQRIIGLHPALIEVFLKDFVDDNVDRGTVILNFLADSMEAGRTL